MKNLTTFKTIPASSVNSLGFSFKSPNLYIFKSRIESSSMASVLVKHKGNSSRNNPQPFKTSGEFANELGSSTTLFNQDAWPVSINASSDKWNGLPSFSIYDVINNGANVSNLSFVYTYWGSNFYENSYTPYFALGSSYYGVDYLGLRLELVFKKPIISNINAIGTEIRNPIIVSWDSNIQDLVDVNIIQSGVVRYSVSGTTSKTAAIPANTLSVGAYEVSVTVANNPYDDMGTTSTLSTAFNATTVNPTITSLEPDGINQNVDNQINVSWVCSNQEKYRLKAYQDNVLIKTYSGNTQKNLVIPAETFKAGNIKLELSCSNTVNGVEATSSRTATFIGYGRPGAPVLDQQYIYNNAKPDFKWESSEQIAYIFEIWKDNAKIEGTTEILGPAKIYTPETALSNNSAFTVKVKIKNQFNLWSDFATKEITVSYTELPKPIFDLTRDGSGILITILMPDTPGLGTLEVWRKDTYSNWVRLAYDMKRTDQWTDNTVASGKEYFYKVIANALNGGMSESDVKTEKANVNDFVFVNIEDTTNKAVLRWNPKVSITNMRKITSKIYAGCTKPKVERGKVKYKIAKMEFTVKKPELEYLQYLADTAQVILFRDRRGEKIYGQISSEISETYEMMDRVNVSFEFTELNFIEKDIHKGSGGIVLTFHNGAWKFDGKITYSGYGVL